MFIARGFQRPRGPFRRLTKDYRQTNASRHSRYFFFLQWIIIDRTGRSRSQYANEDELESRGSIPGFSRIHWLSDEKTDSKVILFRMRIARFSRGKFCNIKFLINIYITEEQKKIFFSFLSAKSQVSREDADPGRARLLLRTFGQPNGQRPRLRREDGPLLSIPLHSLIIASDWGKVPDRCWGRGRINASFWGERGELQ